MESSSLIVFPFLLLCTSLLPRRRGAERRFMEGGEQKMAAEKTNPASNDVAPIVTSFFFSPFLFFSLSLSSFWRDYLPVGGVTVG